MPGSVTPCTSLKARTRGKLGAKALETELLPLATVITPNVPGADYSKYDYEVLDYFSVPVPFRQPYVTGIAEVDPAFLVKITKRQFKIVHAHSPFAAGMAAANVAKRLNIPMVATFHSKYRDDFSQTLSSQVPLAPWGEGARKGG